MEYAIARRTPRYQFVVDVELTDLSVGIRIVAQTITLGRFGCGVATSLPIARGTKVRIKLYHRGAEVKVIAKVVYSSSDLGMGMVFTNVDRENERILQSWIDELESIPVPTP